jgi:hypothetical protein
MNEKKKCRNQINQLKPFLLCNYRYNNVSILIIYYFNNKSNTAPSEFSAVTLLEMPTNFKFDYLLLPF